MSGVADGGKDAELSTPAANTNAAAAAAAAAVVIAHHHHHHHHQPSPTLRQAGKWVVLFFYPFDFTFVCPTEILTFSEKAPEFEAKGVQVRH